MVISNVLLRYDDLGRICEKGHAFGAKSVSQPTNRKTAGRFHHND